MPKPWESVSFLASEVSPTVNPISCPKKDLSLWDASSPPRALPAKLQEGLVCPACQKGDVGLGAAPVPLARGCHCCQCHRNTHQANETEMEVMESGKCCPEHSVSLSKILQTTDKTVYICHSLQVSVTKQHRVILASPVCANTKLMESEKVFGN